MGQILPQDTLEQSLTLVSAVEALHLTSDTVFGGSAPVSSAIPSHKTSVHVQGS